MNEAILFEKRVIIAATRHEVCRVELLFVLLSASANVVGNRFVSRSVLGSCSLALCLLALCFALVVASYQIHRYDTKFNRARVYIFMRTHTHCMHAADKLKTGILHSANNKAQSALYTDTHSHTRKRRISFFLIYVKIALLVRGFSSWKLACIYLPWRYNSPRVQVVCT